MSDSDVETEFIEYLREQDRAITIGEFLGNTSVEDTERNYEIIQRAIDSLEQEGYVTMDIVFTDPDTLKSTTQIYPTDKLYNDTISRIVSSI